MSVRIATQIEIDDRSVPWIAGTNVKVAEIVLDKIAYRSSPEEMHFQYPHLSLSQIHAALAYYYDHQPELDAHIQRGAREYEEIRSKAVAAGNLDLSRNVSAQRRLLQNG